MKSEGWRELEFVQLKANISHIDITTISYSQFFDLCLPNPRNSPGIATARPPTVDKVAFVLYMSYVLAFGAVSRQSMNSATFRFCVGECDLVGIVFGSLFVSSLSVARIMFLSLGLSGCLLASSNGGDDDMLLLPFEYSFAFLATECTNINAPPPRPDDVGLTTPRHNVEAIAASAALPPSLRMVTPTCEQIGWSVATAAPTLFSTDEKDIVYLYII